MSDLECLGGLAPDDPTNEAQQIANILRAAILTKMYNPGQRLPSQPALAEHFGVARETVKRALQSLAVERLIVSRQGSGSYVRTHTQKPVELRPHIEQAFESSAVSIDFAGYTSETLRDALAEPLDKVRAGRLRPETISVRVLLSDMSVPMALPSRVKPAGDDPAVRRRIARIAERAADGIIDHLAGLDRLGIVQRATAEVRVHSAPPLFKLYVINASTAFFGYYNVIRHTVRLGTEDVDTYDPAGKDTALFQYAADDDPASIGSQFVQASSAWFESLWTTISREYAPQ